MVARVRSEVDLFIGEIAIENSRVGLPVLDEEATDPAEAASASMDLALLLAAYERSLILASLAATHGHQRKTAKLLGVLPTTLHAKIKRFKLDVAKRSNVARARPRRLVVGEDFRWRGQLSGARRIDVSIPNGNIYVEPGEGADVQIVAIKRFSGGETLLNVEVSVEQVKTGLQVSTVYIPHVAGDTLASADVPHWDPPACADLRVDLRLKVPRDTELRARSSKGDIFIRGVAGTVRAESAKGRIVVTDGPAG